MRPDSLHEEIWSSASSAQVLAELAMKENAMAYLDVSPMVVALRTTPEEFSLSRSGTWLKHNPSRHSFRFDPGGHVEVRARCNCSLLEIRRSQEDELAQ